MGSPEFRPCDRGSTTGSTPPAPGNVVAGMSVSATAFGDLPSVQAVGTGRAGIVVGFDTEFTTVDGARVIDSYQFAVPEPLDPSVMVEVVILPPLGSGARVSVHTALLYSMNIVPLLYFVGRCRIRAALRRDPSDRVVAGVSTADRR